MTFLITLLALGVDLGPADSVTLYVPFNGSPDAWFARGDGRGEVFSGAGTKPMLKWVSGVDGTSGSALRVSREGAVRFLVPKNLPRQRGTLSLWFSPMDWETLDSRRRTLVSTGGDHLRIHRPGLQHQTICAIGPLEGWSRFEHWVGAWEDGQWHHAVVTWDRERPHASFWLDGKLVGQRGYPADVNSLGWGEQLVLGADPFGNRPTSGAVVVDELLVFDRVLAAQDVAALFKRALDFRSILPNQPAHALPPTARNIAVEGVVLTEQIPLKYSPRAACDGDSRTAWRVTKDQSVLQLRWRDDVAVYAVRLLPAGDQKVERKPLACQLEILAPSGWRQLSATPFGIFESAVQGRSLRLRFERIPETPLEIAELEVLGIRDPHWTDFLPRWKAGYLGADSKAGDADKRPVIRNFRREVELEAGQIAAAYLLMTGHGTLQAWLNGRLLVVRPVADSDRLRTIQHSIPAALFRRGANCLAVGTSGTDRQHSLGVAAEWIVQLHNGRWWRIVTDESWQSVPDPQKHFVTWTMPRFRVPVSHKALVTGTPNDDYDRQLNTPAYRYLGQFEWAAVKDVRLDPPIPRPGRPLTFAITLQIAKRLAGSYALALRLGMEATSGTKSYSWKSVTLTPEQMDRIWRVPGTHQVKLTVDLPPQLSNELAVELFAPGPERPLQLRAQGAAPDPTIYHGLRTTVAIPREDTVP